MWLDRVLAVAGVLRDASWGLSCPFHCGGSWLVSFAAGVSVGILLGFLLSLLIVYQLHLLWTQHPSVSAAPSDPGSLSSLRRRARLSAYLHE